MYLGFRRRADHIASFDELGNSDQDTVTGVALSGTVLLLVSWEPFRSPISMISEKPR
jgi:hypothetical protein